MGYRDEHRQLAAIMFTDIVGYTTLMSESEAAALRVLKRSRQVVRRLARRFKGRWLETVGDGNLVSFASATDAVNCALTIQKNLGRDADLKLRIGIHVGDVIEAGGHIYGDGVNVASRIEGLAEPGGIVVSEPVYDAVRNKSGIFADRLGVRELEGLDHPIQVYALSGESVDSPLLGAIDFPGKRSWRIALVMAAIGLAGVLSAGIYSRYINVDPGDASIVVLPFEDLSPDSSNRYFSEGISAELINGLTRVPGLRVAGRSSSFAIGSSEQDARRIGEKLNVSHILDGSVRKAGNRVRISAQLVETNKGFQLWAETFETEIDDIFKVQQNISQSIVEALRLELMPQEMANVGRVSTRDVQAYDLYLQARRSIRTANSRQEYDEAISLIEKALRRDPTFAEAEAAKCEALVGKYRQTRDTSVMAPAVETCNRALTMDPHAPQAHMALGNLYMATGRADFAVESYARALPLDTDNAELYTRLATALAQQNRLEDAETFFQLAVGLMPESAVIYRDYGVSMFFGGQFKKAEQLLRQAVDIDADYSRAYSDLGAVLYQQGKIDEASEVMLKAIETGPYDKAYNNIGTVLFFAGEYEKSMEMFRKAVELTPQDSRLVGGLADACRLAESCAEWRQLYETALDLSEERLRVNPDDAYIISLKGVHQIFLGHPEEARQALEQAEDIDPNDSQIKVNGAIIWSQLGDEDTAREYLRQAIELGYPEFVLRAHPDISSGNGEVADHATKGGSHEG